jgi:hypothetical protein
LSLPPFSWPGLVALVLAVGVSASLLLAVYLVARGSVTSPGSNALAAIAGAIVGAISTYLGLHRNGDG